MTERRPFVFVSSPRDVADYRDAVQTVHAEMDTASGRLPFGLYDWKKAEDRKPFTDELPPQAIVDESLLAPECMAVIGIVGETLGYDPRPDAATLERLRYAAPAGPGQPGMLHPWPPAGSVMAAEALAAGCFPLTGTTGEILSAIHAKKTLRVFFIGTRNVLEADLLSDIAFGGDRLLNQHGSEKGNKASALKSADWVVNQYYPGVQAVKNLLRYLNRYHGWYPTEERVRLGIENFSRAVRRFYTGNLGVVVRHREGAVFKGLKAYDVDDKDVFFGRSTWVGERLSEFRILDADPSCALLLVIVGASGAGKSSAMRAGLAAHLRDLDEFTPIVLTPDALQGTDPVSAVVSIVDRVCAALDQSFDAAEIRTQLAHYDIEERAAKAAELLFDRIRRRLVRPLLLLDQFDVIALRAIDASDPTAKAVTAFVRALLAPRARPLIGVLCAISDTFADRLSAPDVFGHLLARGAVAEIGLPSDDELLEVIRKPFEVWGAPLDGPANALLRSRLNTFLRDASAEGDVLPLISLQLTRLYEAIKADVEKRIRRRQRLMEASSAAVVISDREIVTHLDFDSFIRDEATKAVDRARARQSVSWTEDEVDGLFDRLVELRSRHEAASTSGSGPGGSGQVGLSTRDSLLLKSDPLPAGLTVAQEVANELTKSRLLVSLGRARYRLVHEVIVWQWPRFTEWLTRRREVLEMIRGLRPLQDVCSQSADEDRPALLASDRHALWAARILVDYADVLTPQNDGNLDAETRSRRDFYLELIGAHPALGGTMIESSKRGTNDRVITMQTPVAHIVALYRRPDVMRRFLAANASIARTVRQPDGRPILVPAIIASDRETVALLIEHGANPATVEQGGDGWSPVTAAAYFGEGELFNDLVRLGADPLQRLSGGWSTLHILAHRNHARLLGDVIRMSPPDRVSAALVTEDGLSAAHVAAQAGHVEVLDALASTHPSILDTPMTADDQRPLFRAAAEGRTAAVAWLAARSDVDIDAIPLSDPRSALMIAAGVSDGATDMVSALLGSARCNPNLQSSSGETALHRAALSGNLGAARQLLAHGGIDPNLQDDNGRTPLSAAVTTQQSAIVTLLSSDARVQPFIADKSGRTILGLAHEQDDESLLASLLARLPEDTRHTEPDGWTPLLLAAAHELPGHVDRFWQGRGQRPIDDVANPRDAKTSQDLLSTVVVLGNVELVRRVLADGRIRRTTVWPKALCEAAKRSDRVEILKLLLQDGRFAPDEPGDYGTGLGKRPAHYAAVTGNVEGLRLLIVGGASLDVRDTWDRRPVDCAPTGVRHEILALVHAGESTLAETGGTPVSAWPARVADEELSALEREAFLSKVAVPDPTVDFTIPGTTFRKRRYPFYPNCTLLEISNPHWTFGLYVRIYAMAVGDLESAECRIVGLDGTSLPIHLINQYVGLQLGTEAAVEYLKFFCFFVWGDDGPFYIVPEEGAPSYIAEDAKLDPGEKGIYGTLQQLYRPPVLHGRSADGVLRASALVYYDDAVYFSEFEIPPSGAVTMAEDEPLITGLGVKVDVPAPFSGRKTLAAVQA